MTPPLVTRATNDVIPALDHNDVKAYIEDGSYRVNTKALEINATEVISQSRDLKSLATITIPVVSSDPGSPVQGQIWFNSTDNQFKGYNGTIVVILG